MKLVGHSKTVLNIITIFNQNLKINEFNIISGGSDSKIIVW